MSGIMQGLIGSYKNISSAITWVFDLFSSGTLDTSKWTSHITTSGTISVTSNELQLTRPASGTINYLDSISTQNSGIIFCQAYLSWDTDSTEEDVAGIIISSSSAPTHGGLCGPYSVFISSREASGGQYRIGIKLAGPATVYDYDSNISKGKEIKITYDTSNNQIKFWYWNTSAWVQMGTTQTYNILNGGNIKFITQYDYINTSLGIVHIDNLYFGTIAVDYSTQYPV